MEIKVGKNEEKKEKTELWCCWCEYKDIYLIQKHDQPTCNKCGRFISKRRYV